MSQVAQSGSPRIVIVRLSAIGDVVHGLPVACALRDALPGVKIAWVVEGRAGDLLTGHDAIDELIRVPRKWLKSPREVWRLRRRLREFQPTVAIDIQGLTKSAIAARLSGAKRRIGLAGVDGRELSPWLNNERVEPSAAHIVDRNLELLRPLGIVPRRVEFRLPELPGDAEPIERFLGANGLGSGPFAVINPGAGWPSKLWPAERFAAVARHLGVTRRMPTVVVWAGEAERQKADTIERESAGQARIAPATSLRELAALVRRARLVVASDTGPLHIAAAVGTPCVGLFGPMARERNGPYGRQHIALQNARLEGSSRQKRTATNATMLAIGAEDVIAACDELLARPVRAAA